MVLKEFTLATIKVTIKAEKMGWESSGRGAESLRKWYLLLLDGLWATVWKVHV